jgi:hypothetical protein
MAAGRPLLVQPQHVAGVEFSDFHLAAVGGDPAHQAAVVAAGAVPALVEPRIGVGLVDRDQAVHGPGVAGPEPGGTPGIETGEDTGEAALDGAQAHA